ncbi:MAG: PIN domain-containing protein [Gemmatimonadaceae bacterium]
MTVGLDTSVVVRLLVGAPPEQAEAARRMLDDQPRSSCAVSDIVVGEAYFALRHHYAVPHARAVHALSALLADSRVRTTGVARQVLAQIPDRESGAGLMDRLIHGDYQRDDIDMLTFDRAAARLTGARRIGT